MVDSSSFMHTMKVNRDLFIRTICLLIVFNLFTAKGASFGTETLAANAILIQIHYIMAYILDGFANASSILTGKAIGSNDKHLYKETIRLSCQWAAISSILCAAMYFLFGEWLIKLFTNISGVIETAGMYELWIMLFPITASFGIVLYGVFTGATEAGPVRDSMILALIVFLMVQFFMVPFAGNHGLWIAFLLFSTGRSVFLVMFIPRLTRKLFPNNKIHQQNLNTV
jgi:MATE family multidrug resistance protein